MSKATSSNSLKPSYVNELFTSLVQDACAQQGIELTKEQLHQEVLGNIASTLQSITSDICSLDQQRFMNGYKKFVYIINQSGSSFSDTPDKKSLNAIHTYINDVPELMKVYNTVRLYRDYEYLLNTVDTMDFKGQNINKFEHQVVSIASSLPDEDCQSLRNGVINLHSKYAEKLSQQNSSNAATDYQPLNEEYLSNYFLQQAYMQIANQPKEYSLPALKAKATKLRKQTLGEIKDNICSFTPLRSNKGYDQFIEVCGLTGIIDYIDANQQSDFVAQHIQNVTELKEISHVWDLYTDYLALSDGSYKLSSSEIFYFEEKVLNAENSLSANNIADIHYGIASLHNKYLSENNDKLNHNKLAETLDRTKKSYTSHLLVALKLTDNPETINKCLYDAPFSHAVNEEAGKACMRALQKKGLSGHDKFNLYRILYNTHLREHRKIGFQLSKDVEKAALHQQQAEHYYNQAKKYATGSEKAMLDIPLKLKHKNTSYN